MNMLKKDLLKRYRKGKVSLLEKQLVEEWYEQYAQPTSLADNELESRIQNLDQKINTIGRKRPGKWLPWATAAAVIFIVGLFSYIHFYSASSSDLPASTWADVSAPTGDNATVTLQNNTQISLDDIEKGDTVTADGYVITRRATGEIQYIADQEASEVVFNTIETGIGGSTTLILSDGTKIWLNAKSKVIYPTVFASDTREVFLEGEGYFEVVSSEKLSDHAPFIVKTHAHTLRVYGTRFNINTYSANYVTTLLEGKIGLKKGVTPLGAASDFAGEVFLEPKQQYTENTRAHIVTLSEPERVLDWKNNYFYLTGQTLSQISEKLSRWYGVAFIMDQSASEQKFFGQISRKKNLSDVLNLMSEVGALSFKLQDNTVLVEQKNKQAN